MKSFAVAVAVFAVVALVVGLRVGDTLVWLLFLAAIAEAAALWRSTTMSSFLKVFTGLFAVETIAFGVVFLLAKTGLWPESFADYLPPESLPLTVAIFGIGVFGVSHIPVIRAMTRIADPYFDTTERGTARLWPFPAFQVSESGLAKAKLIFLVVTNQAQVGIDVRLSFFSRDLFNAIQNKDQAEFWRQLFTVFLLWASIYVASAVVEFVVKSTLIIRWRRFLTARYVGHWLDGHAHYRLSLVGSEADNPDQRIAEDVNRFIDGGASGYGIYSYSILLIATLTSLVSYSIVLWGLSANFTLPGTTIAVPGFLLWVALVYAGFGTLVAHLIGRPLVRLLFNQQRYEADFRFSLARLREYSEQVALLDGERAEQRGLMARFVWIYTNYFSIVDRQKKLIAFTASYGQIGPFIPYIVAAPFYFAGKVTLGVMTQTARAFSSVDAALTFFVTYYASLASFKAVVDRLATFDAAIARVRGLNTVAPRIEAATAPTGGIDIPRLALTIPSGRPVMGAEGLALRPGEPTLVAGPSGSGKSTLLRAIAGIWPFGSGEVATPAGAKVMLLPQRPYIPIGTLRLALAYPDAAETYPDVALREALVAARLPDLVDELDVEANWGQRLSGGEQQRLAIARALLARPDWLFLDEATAALDEVSEAALYRTLGERLPATTLVSVGHRATLAAFHRRRLEMRAGPDGTFRPQDVHAEAAE